MSETFSAIWPTLAEDAPRPPQARRESIGVGIAGLILMGLLAFYLYAPPPLKERLLAPRVPLPQDNYDEPFLVVNAILLLWLPLLFILWGLRAQVGEFGMTPGHPRRGWALAGIGLAVMLPIVFVAAHQPAFQQTYPLRQLIRE